MIRPLNRIISNEETRENLERRYWPKVSHNKASNECWEWRAKATHPYGYGRMSAGRGVNLKAHQIAWALANGPIPDGAVVRHRCDNPPCCNPRHLEIGSQADNVNDARTRGRASQPPRMAGEDHPRHKLSSADVTAIREDHRSARLVANDYGVSTKTIYRVRWGTRV